MDFRFTEKEEAFRQEIREFAKKELPPDWVAIGPVDELSDWDFTMSMSKKLAQKGWLTRHWPKEYGGAGASPIENLIFHEETTYWGIPGVLMGTSGTCWVGPSLIVFGTEEQKKKYLPPIATGEPDGVWCTGYSEPDAGTDLASLKTSAVREGDEYIINGQKIWTSMAHHARWCWLLARTDPHVPKHKGLSLIIVDMKSPGVTVKPVIDITGSHLVNEVFFDDVHVSVTELVGEENRGWYQVMTALNFERASVSGISFASPGGSKRLLEELVNYTKETKYNGEPLCKNSLVRHKLANIALEVEIVRMSSYKIAWLECIGQIPAVDASMLKIFTTESTIRLANTGMEILGPYSQLKPGSKWAKLHGVLQGIYLQSFVGRFGGGTNEIQRNIIAQFGLGLPR